MELIESKKSIYFKHRGGRYLLGIGNGTKVVAHETKLAQTPQWSAQIIPRAEAESSTLARTSNKCTLSPKSSKPTSLPTQRGLYANNDRSDFCFSTAYIAAIASNSRSSPTSTYTTPLAKEKHFDGDHDSGSESANSQTTQTGPPHSPG
jgi:hypothetical protein